MSEDNGGKKLVQLEEWQKSLKDDITEIKLDIKELQKVFVEIAKIKSQQNIQWWMLTGLWGAIISIAIFIIRKVI